MRVKRMSLSDSNLMTRLDSPAAPRQHRTMKYFTALSTALVLFGTAFQGASAQTRIGNVTLTKPVQQPAPFRPAPAPVASAASNNSMTAAQVPAGFYEIRGRVSAAQGNVTLPAGSTISVSVNDLTRPAQVVQIGFKTTRLSTPYQVFFNPSRINPAHRYAVQATVTDASGKVLYRSDASALMPQSKSSTVNVTVR